MQFLAIRIFLKRTVAIVSLMKDPTVPLRKKALVVFGLAFIILPLPPIPPIIFPIALLDDLLVWILIVWYLSDYLDKYWLGDKTEDIKKNFDGKDIVNDVEFEVDSDEDEDDTIKDKKEDDDE